MLTPGEDYKQLLKSAQTEVLHRLMSDLVKRSTNENLELNNREINSINCKILYINDELLLRTKKANRSSFGPPANADMDMSNIIQR
jgi:hypothetical protein